MPSYAPRMPLPPETISIGELADRSGVSVAALRFYEERGLIVAERSAGNQRRYRRAVLRRVAFIRAAQRLGLSLGDIATALAGLPADRDPKKADWTRLSTRWRTQLDERIQELERLRDELTGCIGCGCLSLRRCALLNAADQAATSGPGARYLLGDNPPSVERS